MLLLMSVIKLDGSFKNCDTDEVQLNDYILLKIFNKINPTEEVILK